MSHYAFAVDECVRFTIVHGLRAADVDVLDGRIDMSGWDDPKILARCWRERRLLVSHDYDHSDLIFRDGLPAFGVILFAPNLFVGPNAPNAFDLAREIGRNPRPYIHTVTIISAKRIRRKAIPQSR
ncbi:MAG: DUF5615 family PIN-like protein [Beijerinckiaceae bacterium]